MSENKFDTKRYWEVRYRSGGTAGAGSTGRLAAFKAAFLNDFVKTNGIGSVIEFGCGAGTQLQLFDFPKYLGIDVSERALGDARTLHADNPNYAFLLDTELSQASECDLSLSLDVIYHLVEDDIFEKYLRDLFFFANRFVIIYSSDFDGGWSTPHVRHRNFTATVATRFPEWRLIASVKNIYPFDEARQNETSFADFFIYGRHSEPCVLAVPPPAEG